MYLARRSVGCLVAGRYREPIVDQVTGWSAEGLYLVGDYGRDILTRLYQGEEYSLTDLEGADYLLEVCRDSREILTYRADGTLVGPGPFDP